MQESRKDLAIEQVKKSDVERGINVLWFLLAIGIFIAFRTYPPMAIFLSAPLLVSKLIALFCTIPIFLGGLGIRSIDGFIEAFQKHITAVLLVLFVMIAPFILIDSYFTSYLPKYIDEKIDKEGVYTKARIYTFKYNRNRYLDDTSIYIYLRYFDKKKQLYQQKVALNVGGLRRGLRPNQLIEIKYLKDNPRILRIIVGDNVEKFKHIPNRRLKYQDIPELFRRQKDSKALYKYLNTLSNDWQQVWYKDEYHYWNYLKHISFKISNDVLVMDISSLSGFRIPNDVVEALPSVEPDVKVIITTEYIVYIFETSYTGLADFTDGVNYEFSPLNKRILAVFKPYNQEEINNINEEAWRIYYYYEKGIELSSEDPDMPILLCD